jgi:hypothetical protein
MFRNFHDPAYFEPTDQHRNLASCSSQPAIDPSWPAIIALRMMWDALREGLAAHRQYEELRSRGIHHDTALRQALGIGVSRSQLTRETVDPLYFAGRA